MYTDTLVLQPGLGDRTINLPQGRLLGGSSGLNAQTLVAPSKAGIDAWATFENPGWDWSSLSPYYRKCYTLNLPDETIKQHLGLDWIDENVAGNSGPIQTSFTGVIENPMPKAWVETFQALGVQKTTDPFTGTSLGAYSNMSAINPTSKTRSYAASGYAVPAMKRPNLSIIFEAEVQKVLLRESSSKEVEAHGVEAIISGRTQTIKAKKEVIIAAGVFQSPKVLELSGIGGHKLLQKYGIETIIDNPNVGENLQDHLTTAISFEVVDSIQTADPLMRREPEALKAAQEMYQTKKTGPFCIGGIG